MGLLEKLHADAMKQVNDPNKGLLFFTKQSMADLAWVLLHVEELEAIVAELFPLKAFLADVRKRYESIETEEDGG